jgi:hypothetical protein
MKKRNYVKSNLWKRAFKSLSLEPVIRPIFRNFIEPFVEGTTLPIDPVDLMNMWFDVENRAVYFATFKKNVKIPGKVRHPDNYYIRIPTADKKVGHRGDQCVVRFDERLPNIVELEYNDQVFIMDTAQWVAISHEVALHG